ncbi:PrsW family intramembrane metalloprotease [Humidisolicoccus flavus]|uniref:PrsW family intramembrane metalloprotease n=1 Tax=Humidisolicoccus flavus TaxID=3111414 RepID=UPI00324309E3
MSNPYEYHRPHPSRPAPQPVAVAPGYSSPHGAPQSGVVHGQAPQQVPQPGMPPQAAQQQPVQQQLVQQPQAPRPQSGPGVQFGSAPQPIAHSQQQGLPQQGFQNAPAQVPQPGRRPRSRRGKGNPTIALLTGHRGPLNAAFYAGIASLVVLALGIPFVINFFAQTTDDTIATVISFFVALIPLSVVLFGLWAIDRWEPEPRLTIWFSLLWGAIGAIVLTLLVADALVPVLVSYAQNNNWTEQQFGEWYNGFWGPVIQAPFVEELWKAVPVIILFVFFRRLFDGPIDGVVVAGLSAAGFAFTENISYFLRTLADGSDVTSTFFVRAIMSPFTHTLFTAIGIGLAMGLAARLNSRWWGLLAFIPGYLVSVGLHMLWNGSNIFLPAALTQNFFLYYVVVQVPIFLLGITVVVLLRHFEVRLTRTRLMEYSASGWFTPSEVDALSTGDGRTLLRRWAKARGVRSEMQDYIATTTKLANARQRVITGRDRIGSIADESQLLDEMLEIREELLVKTRTSAPVPQYAVPHGRVPGNPQAMMPQPGQLR